MLCVIKIINRYTGSAFQVRVSDYQPLLPWLFFILLPLFLSFIIPHYNGCVYNTPPANHQPPIACVSFSVIVFKDTFQRYTLHDVCLPVKVCQLTLVLYYTFTPCNSVSSKGSRWFIQRVGRHNVFVFVRSSKADWRLGPPRHFY